MKEYGPQLSHAVIMGVGGQALRSDLDTLAEPLKALVTCQPKAKTWLMDALSSETFPCKNVGPTEKRMWLQKILKYVFPSIPLPTPFFFFYLTVCEFFFFGFFRDWLILYTLMCQTV